MNKTGETISSFVHTSVGLIPIGWEEKSLGECCIIKGEYGINAAAVEYSPDLPTYLRITDIDEDGNFLSIDKKSVDNPNSSEYILHEGDIVFARTGATVGKSYLHNSKNGLLVFAGFLIRFRTDNKVLLPQYLKLYSQTNYFWGWVKVVSMRSGQPGINGTEYSQLPVLLPPVSEQIIIINTLALWNRAIDALQQLIEQKERLKKALMQKLLIDKDGMELRHNSNRYSYGDLVVEVVRPVDWDETKKYDLISVRRNSGGLFQRESLYGYQILTKNLRTTLEGDFLISKMQVLHGATGLTTSEFDGMHISGSYIAVRTKDKDILDIEYLNWFSKTSYFYYQTFISSYGVAIEKMTFDFEYFLQEQINLPDIASQRNIVAILNAAEEEIQLLIQKLSLIKDQKKGLIQKLLTGQLRIMK